MYQDGQHRIISEIMFVFQLCPRNPFHHRSNSFEMRRVGRQADGDGATLIVDGVVITQVVFHIAIFDLLLIVLGVELTKYF